MMWSVFSLSFNEDVIIIEVPETCTQQKWAPRVCFFPRSPECFGTKVLSAIKCHDPDQNPSAAYWPEAAFSVHTLVALKRGVHYWPAFLAPLTAGQQRSRVMKDHQHAPSQLPVRI